jgi:formate hydrogenlyase subunit 3/multisubunit Na+/H+ antiporter MnhD subunit
LESGCLRSGSPSFWFTFNVLFMLPGPYSVTIFGLAGIGIAAGVAAAWFSGRQFMLAWGRNQLPAEVVKAPPVVLCIFILCLFCVMGVIKVVAAYR